MIRTVVLLALVLTFAACKKEQEPTPEPVVEQVELLDPRSRTLTAVAGVGLQEPKSRLHRNRLHRSRLHKSRLHRNRLRRSRLRKSKPRRNKLVRRPSRQQRRLVTNLTQ